MNYTLVERFIIVSLQWCKRIDNETIQFTTVQFLKSGERERLILILKYSSNFISKLKIEITLATTFIIYKVTSYH